MDIHLLTGQLQTSSHQLEIEVGRYTRIPLEERIYQLCHQGVESEEHYVIVVSFMKSQGDTIASLNKAFAHYTR